MQSNIDRYLEYVLIRKGRLSLPGIGSIVMSQVPAYFTQGKTVLHPPKLNFSFTSSDSQSPELPQIIAFNEQWKLEKAEKAVATFSNEILNNLVNYEIAEINGLGYLQKKDNVTEFIPHNSLLGKSYYGLKPIKSNAIRKNFTTTNPINSQSVAVEHKKIEREWMNYLLALLLGGLMVAAYHYFVDPYGHKASDDIATITKPISEDNSGTTTLNPSSNNSANSDLPVITPNPQDSVAKQDNLRNSENLDIIKSNPPIRPRRQPQISNTDSADINLAQPKQDQKCIILVGVYSETIRALAMMDRIRAKGYEPFRDVLHDANRVGVQFNCSDYGFKEMLERVRKDISQEAHYLQPKITI